MDRVRQHFGAWLVVGIVVTLALPAGLLAERTKLKPGFNLFSKQQDIDLGREASQQVSKEVPLLNDARVDRYLQRLGEKLAKRSLAPDYPYTFRAVNVSDINAFALPGGPIYINRGIIANADNEAQLAGVMAHEITHVALRHGTNQLSKAMPAALLGQLLAGAIGGGGLGGQLAQLGIGLGLNSVLLKYSRDAERQADIGGTQILYDTNYNPHAMAQFFEKVKKESRGGSVPEFFSNHPDPGNREKLVEAEVRTLGDRGGYTNDSAEFREIKRYVQGLPRAPKAGAQPGSSRPSGERPPEAASRRLQVYRGHGFQIHFPENWSSYPDQDGLGVLVAPERGVFADERGQSQIAYGTMVRFFRPREGLNLEESTGQLVKQIQASNPVRVVPNSKRRLTVDGQRALSYYLSGPSPVGGNERDWLVALQRDDGLMLYLIFIAPESDFARFDPSFRAMLSTLRSGPQ